LISVSRRGAGSGGRDMTLHRRCDAKGPAVQAAMVPARGRRAPRALMATPGPRQRGTGKAWSSTVVWAFSPLIARLPGISRSRPTKHRARDAEGLADLRFALPIARTSVRGEAQGLRQASMSRGVEARGSNWTPGVPRALGSFPGDADLPPRRRRTRRRKEIGRRSFVRDREVAV